MRSGESVTPMRSGDLFGGAHRGVVTAEVDGGAHRGRQHEPLTPGLVRTAGDVNDVADGRGGHTVGDTPLLSLPFACYT
ncbi:hypothetical protein MSAS_56900 [Mycobacterium saskatchewanense]|uniref:Uncharacterized protein n=1 Tax=Mycobacterium saskatchewanense TaxID=220927 RepID=A0AAJ3NNB1_9MYCO|nr:hypothetical protein AWC23_21640 [Mycobacterium saskatchewanense]BBX66516.1 hypothetical protein MSAS_56900 [Mycobacterium saskatchewanense]